LPPINLHLLPFNHREVSSYRAPSSCVARAFVRSRIEPPAEIRLAL